MSGRASAKENNKKVNEKKQPISARKTVKTSTKGKRASTSSKTNPKGTAFSVSDGAYYVPPQPQPKKRRVKKETNSVLEPPVKKLRNPKETLQAAKKKTLKNALLHTIILKTV